MSDDGRLALFGRVANDRRLRRLVASYGIYSVAEQATWLAITVYAFDRGGVGEAGMVAFVMLAPAIVVTPFASAASDRFRTDVVLAAGYGAQASSMICTALAMAVGGPAPVVYGFATLTSVCVTLSRPALGAVLPAATPTPAHLAAARVSIGIADNAGVLLGPAVAGVFLIGDSGPAWTFAVMGVSMVAATVLVVGLGLARSEVTSTSDETAGDAWRKMIGGFTALRRNRDLRTVVVVTTLGALVIGATDVLFVSVAQDLLGRSGSTAGVLGVAFGLGALAGAFGTAPLILRSALALPLALAVAAGGVAIASMAPMSSLALVAVAFAVCGASTSLADIIGNTLVPRLAPSRLLARVYGVMEAARVATVALGSVAVSVLASLLGIRAALVLLGLAIPAGLLLASPRIREADRGSELPDPEALRLLAGDPIFSRLPAPLIEQLIAGMERRAVEAGVDVIRQGEPGDAYYLIADGVVEVSVDGAPVRVQGSGTGFGEIALVRDVPRTATVRSTTRVILYCIRRPDFLTALTGNPAALQAADAHTERRLDEDMTRDGDGNRAQGIDPDAEV